MEHMFKKTSLALIVLGLSTVAFANGGSFTAPAKSDFAVTVPNQDAGWHVGANGLVFQVSNRDMNYATTSTVSGSTTHTSVDAVEPDYDIGFDVNAGYHFEGTGSDVTAAFEYFSNDDSDTTTGATASSVTTVNGDFHRARGENDLDYYAIDLMGHEAVDVGNNLDMHLGAGLRYANIDNEFTTRGFDNLTNELGNASKNESDAWGIGPRITFDGFYDIYQGFGLEAGLGASLLYGETDYTVTDTSFNSATGPGTITNVDKKDDSNQLIPELDAKIGLGYNYHINQDYSMNFHAGWKTIHYFDVVDNSGFALGAGTSGSDLSMSGPYFGITLKG